MPYKVFKASNGKYCVHKHIGGKKGKKIGCHSSQSKAQAQMRALYANESKEADMAQMPDAVIELVEKEEGAEEEAIETKDRLEKGYVPWGVTSFADLESAREAAEAAERTYDVMSDFTGIVSNILSDSEIEDKADAVRKATDEMQSLLKSGGETKEQKEPTIDVSDTFFDKLKSWMTDFFTTKETGEEITDDRGEFMTWKEADGTLRWMATYSNKFRDVDKPPEIISEISHKRFENLVDTKQVDMPELWLWHETDWKFGVADWIAWDDYGFSLASGKVDEGQEAVAEWVGKQRDVAVSHGMPNDSIIRDPDDQSIIVGHVTREISALPYKAAANKRTDFHVFGDESSKNKQEDVMAISDEKKKKLQETWSDAPPSLLENLEASNADKAQKALAENVEFKEAEETEEQTEVVEEETSETAESAAQEEEATQSEPEESEAQATDAGDEPEPDYPTRDEVVEAITPIAKQVEEQGVVLNTILETLKELVETDEEKISKAVDDTPPASIAAILAQNLSAVGAKETLIKGSEKLAKSKPAEAPSKGPTGIEFLDAMLQPEQ